MPENRNIKDAFSLIFLVVLNSVLVITNTACYGSGSSLASRLVLATTFFILVITIILSNSFKNPMLGTKVVLITFFLSSLFFLIWRSFYFTPEFIGRRVNTEAVVLSQRYTANNHLVFDSPHSYFFLQPLVLNLLCNLGGFSSEIGIYFSLILYGVLAAISGILVYKALSWGLQNSDQKNGLLKAVFPLTAFLLISCEYSERYAATSFGAHLIVMAMWLLFGKKVKKRSESIVLLLLVTGITLGDPNGILVLIPLFLLFPILGRQKTAFLYAAIPIAYFVFSAYSYASVLAGYTKFAYNGLIEFLQKVISGHLPEQVIPWQRTASRVTEDTYIASATYLSLFGLSLIVVVVSLFLWIRERRKANKNGEDALNRAGLICLLFFTSIAAVTYVGVSMEPERTFSDIRTITITFLSLLLPFLFISKRLIAYVGSRKILLSFVIILIIVASMRTVWDIYPKSISDPIYVVEDERLGSTSVYAIADFLNTYYKTGGIVGDYTVLIHIDQWLSNSEYETRRLHETTLTEPFARFPYRSILVFNIAGTTYPSLYQSKEAYVAAYNFSMTHNRLYDNGVVVIVSQEKGTS